MTRLALGDPAMGAAIAVTNAAELGARLRDLRGVLDAWQAELDRPDGPDEKGATARLAAARPILEEVDDVSEERVFVVPRAAVIDEAGWYGLRTDGLDGVRRRPRTRRPLRAARPRWSATQLQAGHPVPRACATASATS